MLKRFPSGSSVQFYDTIDSTSLEAKRLAKAGAAGPLWITAGQQTAGYGRRGSAWFQAEGDVAASFIFAPRGDRMVLAQLSYVAALAVSDTIAACVKGADVSVKWPNDILIDDKKAAGILLELLAGDDPVIVLGVGVNVVSAPAEVEYPVARVFDHSPGNVPAPLEIIENLDAAFARWREVWREEGFVAIKTHWLERAARLGEKITVRLPDKERVGLFKGISDDGALVLATDEGDELITAGAVFFGETTP